MSGGIVIGIVFGIVGTAVGLSMLGMAIGVVFRRPCLRGSCGGPPVRGADGTPVGCAGCPNRRKA